MEIERKFKLNKSKFFEKLDKLEILKKTVIEQSYISVTDNEVRIRKVEDLDSNNLYYLTIKSKGELSRSEVEFEIHSSKYEEILNNNICLGDTIKKFRYAVKITDDLVAEVDVYGASLIGLMVVEVEFNSEEEAESFEKPDWFGEDITSDENYKNRNLALKKAY